ncbi:MAG: hypothetical protein N2316_10955 [Spirochaetes bacterium]|nr:hypothetical protein [Spirochaetota bacterium]
MIKSSRNRFGKDLYLLFPGEYLAIKNENCVLVSVTNACIVVCLFEVKQRIAAMGHFILPGAIGTEGIAVDEIAQQGITDMEYIMGDIVKLGGDRKQLRATFFASLPENGNDPCGEQMVRNNVRFLRLYFSTERIPVIKEAISAHTQKILLYCPSGRIHRMAVDAKKDYSEFLRRENDYMKSIIEKKQRQGKVILFE